MLQAVSQADHYHSRFSEDIVEVGFVDCDLDPTIKDAFTWRLAQHCVYRKINRKCGQLDKQSSVILLELLIARLARLKA